MWVHKGYPEMQWTTFSLKPWKRWCQMSQLDSSVWWRWGRTARIVDLERANLQPQKSAGGDVGPNEHEQFSHRPRDSVRLSWQHHSSNQCGLVPLTPAFDQVYVPHVHPRLPGCCPRFAKNLLHRLTFAPNSNCIIAPFSSTA